MSHFLPPHCAPPALDCRLWTPEIFEWSKVSIDDPRIQAVITDLGAAHAARDAVGAPFKLATCGWVIGPLGNRSYLDGMLAPDWAISSIDQDVGNTPVDPAYANVTQHKKWAIPWLEDDPGLTAPQLWVNRSLVHNAQALGYGVSSLLNIHWRTRSIAPQAAASHAWAWNTNLTSLVFWADWTLASFGPSAAPGALSIFTSLDSYDMPRPVSWVTGPGTWAPSAQACTTAANGTYAFADAVYALRPLILADIASGRADASHLERLDYWLTSFRYMRNIARTSCAWVLYAEVVKQITAMPAGPARQAAARAAGYSAFGDLVGNATAAQWDLLSSATTLGELGTIANSQGQSLLPSAVGPDAQAALAILAGEPLPPSLLPAATWDAGRVPLLRVPVVRGVLAAGEDLRLTAIVVAHPTYTPLTVTLWASQLGSPSPHWAFYNMTQATPAGGVQRMLYSATVPAAQLDAEAGVQWYIEAVLPGNTTSFDGPSALVPSPGATFGAETILLRFPPTAPARPQTVVVV